MSCGTNHFLSSFVPLLHSNWQMHYPPLWLLVFGVWYLILLNSECVTFHFSLFYFLFSIIIFSVSVIKPLDIRVNVYIVCACVYIICFSFFGSLLTSSAFSSIHPSYCVWTNFSFRIRVSCLLSVSFYCGYCVMFSKQDLTISISRVFEYSVFGCSCALFVPVNFLLSSSVAFHFSRKSFYWWIFQHSVYDSVQFLIFLTICS